MIGMLYLAIIILIGFSILVVINLLAGANFKSHQPAPLIKAAQSDEPTPTAVPEPGGAKQKQKQKKTAVAVEEKPLDPLLESDKEFAALNAKSTGTRIMQMQMTIEKFLLREHVKYTTGKVNASDSYGAELIKDIAPESHFLFEPAVYFKGEEELLFIVSLRGQLSQNPDEIIRRIKETKIYDAVLSEKNDIIAFLPLPGNDEIAMKMIELCNKTDAFQD